MLVVTMPVLDEFGHPVTEVKASVVAVLIAVTVVAPAADVVEAGPTAGRAVDTLNLGALGRDHGDQENGAHQLPAI